MNIKQYRKKPVVIEAMQVLGGTSFDEVKEFTSGTKMTQIKNDIYLLTLEGDMRVSLGDYIIKGVKGEFYPCKPDIFKATYDEVK
jgi:hypothetical protein